MSCGYAYDMHVLEWVSCNTAFCQGKGCGLHLCSKPACMLLKHAASNRLWGDAGHLHPGHTFVLASVKTYGHLGRPIMPYLCTLSDVASARSLAVTRESFLAMPTGN
jgi:hypothetical protein